MNIKIPDKHAADVARYLRGEPLNWLDISYSELDNIATQIDVEFAKPEPPEVERLQMELPL